MKHFIQNILDFSKTRDQISIICMNKFTYNNVFIKSLSSPEISQHIIQQKKFSKLIILDIYDNKNINDVNHLGDTLIELNCGGYTNGVTQLGISKLKNLKYLNIYDNNKIKCIRNFADTLEGLNCGGGLSSISQNNLDNLTKLKYLNIYCNDKINDLNHLKDTLIGVNCGSFYAGRMKIKQDGIKDLEKLEILFSENNHNINKKNINNIITNNMCYCESDSLGIKTLDIYISNDKIFRERFDELKNQIYKIHMKNISN